MRIVGWTAGVALVALLVAPAAWAQDPGGPAAQVAALVRRDLHGDAMHACDDALPLAPGDGELELTCAQVYFSLYRLDDAERCALAAVELLPTSATPLGLLAASYERRGDDAGARRELQRALALEPGSPFAEAMLRRLDERAALRQPAPEPTAGSPAHVVWDLLEAARAGRLGPALLPAIDPAALVAARRAAQLPVSGDDAAVARRFVDALGPYLARQGTDLLGYELGPGSAPEGDAARVTVRLLAVRPPDMNAAPALARRLEAPPAAGQLPPPGGSVYRSLAQADRLPYLRRRSNLAVPFTLPLAFTLRRAGGAWRIVDLVAGERPLTALLRELDGAPALVPAHPAPGAHPTTLTKIVAIVAGVGFVVYMLARRRPTS